MMMMKTMTEDKMNDKDDTKLMMDATKDMSQMMGITLLIAQRTLELEKKKMKKNNKTQTNEDNAPLCVCMNGAWFLLELFVCPLPPSSFCALSQ